MNDLSLEVRLVDHIVVHHADDANPGGDQIKPEAHPSHPPDH